jgi:hypothetical protein
VTACVLWWEDYGREARGGWVEGAVCERPGEHIWLSLIEAKLKRGMPALVNHILTLWAYYYWSKDYTDSDLKILPIYCRGCGSECCCSIWTGLYAFLQCLLTSCSHFHKSQPKASHISLNHFVMKDKLSINLLLPYSVIKIHEQFLKSWYIFT